MTSEIDRLREALRVEREACDALAIAAEHVIEHIEGDADTCAASCREDLRAVVAAHDARRAAEPTNDQRTGSAPAASPSSSADLARANEVAVKACHERDVAQRRAAELDAKCKALRARLDGLTATDAQRQTAEAEAAYADMRAQRDAAIRERDEARRINDAAATFVHGTDAEAAEAKDFIVAALVNERKRREEAESSASARERNAAAKAWSIAAATVRTRLTYTECQSPRLTWHDVQDLTEEFERLADAIEKGMA